MRQLPVEDGEWLRLVEAVAFAGRHAYTIRNRRAAGLLPNTQHPTSHVYRYLRADLQRVLRAPRYRAHDVDSAAPRARIEAAGM